MNKLYDYPIYKWVLSENELDEDPDLGLTCISLVDKPAVNRMALKYADDTEPIKLNYSNEDEMIFTSVALLAEAPIKRKNKAGEYYYTTFPKETIKELVMRYFKYNIRKVNINHSIDTKGAYLFESYIVNKEKGIDNPLLDTTDGSWVVSYKITDPILWEAIKNDEINGLSVEISAFLEKYTIIDNNKVNDDFNNIKLSLEELNELNKTITNGDIKDMVRFYSKIKNKK